MIRIFTLRTKVGHQWFEFDMTDTDMRSILRAMKRCNKTIYASLCEYVEEVITQDGKDFNKWFNQGIVLSRLLEKSKKK
jgi:hypothetical protein